MSDLRQREGRPADNGAAISQSVQAGGPNGSILAARPDAVTNDTVPTLDVMPPRARRIALAYFEAGRAEGIAAGRRQVEAELAAEWAALRAEVMPRLRTAIPFADLADRRGQHERAERSRQTLRDRGIAS